MKIIGVSRNTVKKYRNGQIVPWERKPGSARKNNIITDEVKTFIRKNAELKNVKKSPQRNKLCGVFFIGKYKKGKIIHFA